MAQWATMFANLVFVQVSNSLEVAKHLNINWIWTIKKGLDSKRQFDLLFWLFTKSFHYYINPIRFSQLQRMQDHIF